MRHLYLMRHAKAKQPSGDMTDHQRPLRKRGKRQAAAMAHVLQRWQALEGEIYVSTAVRTQSTFDEIAAQLLKHNLGANVHFDEDLFTFDGGGLQAWLKALPDETEKLLLIGHNPALHELARWLDNAAPHSLPTGSVLHFTLPDTAWKSVAQGGAKLSNFITPEAACYRLFQRLAPELNDNKQDAASRVHEMLEYQYQMIRALETGVIAGVDPEFLHQYRVNLRRSRAVGESVHAITRVPGLKKMLKRLKHRAQATSELRDIDVFLEDMTKTPPPLSSVARKGLMQWLQDCQRERHRTLCQQLSAPAYAEDMQAWQHFITSDDVGKAFSKLTPKRICKVLAERIARHDEDLAALSLDSDDDEFHKLRKDVKRIRYLADLNPETPEPFLSALKHRQRLLGEYQDLCSRQAWLDAFSPSPDNEPQRQECNEWRDSLEKPKLALRNQILALNPLANVAA